MEKRSARQSIIGAISSASVQKTFARTNACRRDCLGDVCIRGRWLGAIRAGLRHVDQLRRPSAGVGGAHESSREKRDRAFVWKLSHERDRKLCGSCGDTFATFRAIYFQLYYRTRRPLDALYFRSEILGRPAGSRKNRDEFYCSVCIKVAVFVFMTVTWTMLLRKYNEIFL